MKIEKFNEEKSKKYHICMIIYSDGGILKSGVFDNRKDLDIWLLNIINTRIVDFYEQEFPEDVVIADELYNEDSIANAINWYQDINDCNIYYDNNVKHFKDVKLKYSVYLDSKKYNL